MMVRFPCPLHGVIGSDVKQTLPLTTTQCNTELSRTYKTKVPRPLELATTVALQNSASVTSLPSANAEAK